ncbi:MAG: hypothetical protein JNK26_03725 [Candidatus Doudnabacteria bacterium]|nr:hypothetical protein [Candidatus Doudnabacteria bacterium]
MAILNLFLISFLLILSFIFHPNYSRVSAHSILDGVIFVNGQPLDLNPVPQGSKLEWAEQVVNISHAPGAVANLRVDIELAKEILNKDELSFQWQFGGTEALVGDTVQLPLNNPGNYIGKLFISSAEEPIYAESIMIVAGRAPAAPAPLVNGQSQLKVAIARDQIIQLSVPNPDESKYLYSWDLGDGEVINSVLMEKRFTTTRLPVDIILRVTDLETGVFSDSYVTLTALNELEADVPMPPAPQTESPSSDKQSISPVVMIGIGLVVVGSVAVMVQRFRSSRKPEPAEE